MAEKLNRHREKKLIKFLIPIQGFSFLSGEGGSLHDPEADKVFLVELRKRLDPDIEIVEVEAHISTPEFAGAIVSALEDSLKELSGAP